MSKFKRGYIENRERFMENLRRDRWHATYNAALTGLHAVGALDVEGGHKYAVAAANLAHGALEHAEQTSNWDDVT